MVRWGLWDVNRALVSKDWTKIDLCGPKSVHVDFQGVFRRHRHFFCNPYMDSEKHFMCLMRRPNSQKVVPFHWERSFKPVGNVHSSRARVEIQGFGKKTSRQKKYPFLVMTCHNHVSVEWLSGWVFLKAFKIINGRMDSRSKCLVLILSSMKTQENYKTDL